MKQWQIYLVLAAIAAAILAIVYYFRKQIMALFAPAKAAAASTTTSTSTEAGTGTGAASGNTEVDITGTDSLDPFPRDWQLFTSNPTGARIGTQGNYGTYSIGAPLKKTVLNSGQTWTLSSADALPKGDYYLIIGQSGGLAYGSYSGTIVIGSGETATTLSFSGVTADQATHFVIS